MLIPYSKQDVNRFCDRRRKTVHYWSDYIRNRIYNYRVTEDNGLPKIAGNLYSTAQYSTVRCRREQNNTAEFCLFLDFLTFGSGSRMIYQVVGIRVSVKRKIHWRTDQIPWRGDRPVAEGDPPKAPQGKNIWGVFGIVSGFYGVFGGTDVA